MKAASVVPSAELIAKYAREGPRYTSYPPAPYWSPSYTQDEYRAALREAGEEREREFSLYMHVPFCEHRCTFCACNVIISRAHERGASYIDLLAHEMDLALGAMGAKGRRPPVRQMHWGGGTPTWLSAGELDALCARVAERFEMLPDREQSIEVDPRVTTREQLEALARHGLTRVSMGVQDFDAKVQEAIHRIQPVDMTRRVIDDARALGVTGVNIDLVYGLPHQTVAGFSETVRTVIQLGADRVALYNFAYLPERLTHHKAIHPEWLPPAETRIELFRAAAALFEEAGYDMIGLDHFAKRTDELFAARADGTLQRNFMGYTTRAGADLLSFGVSSISRIGRDFAQNLKTTDAYERTLADGALPIERGLRLSDDDLAREEIIGTLMCYGRVDFAQIEARHGLDALADEQTRRALDSLAADDLLEMHGRALVVTPLGRYFLRNVAMTFDAYLRRPTAPHTHNGKPVEIRFSRTV